MEGVGVRMPERWCSGEQRTSPRDTPLGPLRRGGRGEAGAPTSVVGRAPTSAAAAVAAAGSAAVSAAASAAALACAVPQPPSQSPSPMAVLTHTRISP
eukprot:8789212-Pyramimonas_sp.AAC.1